MTAMAAPDDDVGTAAHGRRISWRAQVLSLLALVLVAALSVAVGGALYVVRTSVAEETESKALAIARTVAADPRYAVWVTSGPPSPNGPAQQAAQEVVESTHALYVVVADGRGIRYSHPEPDQVGLVVSTDPRGPLRGEDEVAIEQGSLGWSARGKVPLRSATGAIVGLVSVGVPVSQVDALQRRWSIVVAGIGAAALAAGLLGLAAFWRRLRRATHGLEPEEMADLLREQAAVLGGAWDGIVAVDTAGRVRICNGAARRYLGTPVTVGRPAARSGLPAPILALLDDAGPSSSSSSHPVTGRLVVAHGRVLDARRLPVVRQGRDLGVVVVLSDRTDLDDLGRELEATRALTDALRAQAHEHANQLHALSGMLHLGHEQDALAYLAELAGGVSCSGQVEEPYLAGLLGAKTAAASERGVELRVAQETHVAGRLGRPLDCVTVVGNLLDNATRAAVTGRRRPAWVEVALYTRGNDLHVRVVDSGDGVPAHAREVIFEQGWTSKTAQQGSPGVPGGHGVGLALARATARRHRGDVHLVAGSGEGHGAVFTALLAGVLTQRSEHVTKERA